MTRAWRAAITLSLTACGGQVSGTAAAPAGTEVVVYHADDADCHVAATRRHNDPLIRLFAGIDSAHFRADLALAGLDSLLKSPSHAECGTHPIGRGTVGVGGVLAMDGRYRGRIALTIEQGHPNFQNCRVNADMPLYGNRSVTLAGAQCLPWPVAIDPAEVRRELERRWREDSLEMRDLARSDSAHAAAEALTRGWQFVADRDGVYYFRRGSPCAREIAPSRLVYLRDSSYAHLKGYARSEEPGC